MNTSEKIRQFEQLLKEVAIEIRKELSQIETVSRMDFSISIEGRVHDGELLVKMGLGEYGSDVSGHNVTVVVEEFMRRHGWNKRNTPLCLSAVEEA